LKIRQDNRGACFAHLLHPSREQRSLTNLASALNQHDAVASGESAVEFGVRLSLDVKRGVKWHRATRRVRLIPILLACHRSHSSTGEHFPPRRNSLSPPRDSLDVLGFSKRSP